MYANFPLVARSTVSSQYLDNAAENGIRHLALGLKNYLVRSNDESAGRTVDIYSLLGSCKLAGGCEGEGKDKKRGNHTVNIKVSWSYHRKVIDEMVQLPFNETDEVPTSILGLETTLLRKYPYFAKRINFPIIGKLMVKRGYKTKILGQNKATYYKIRKISKLLRITDDYNQEKYMIG